MTGAIAVTFILAGCLVLFEWILPRSTLPLPWQRKLIHVSICLAVACFGWILPYQWFLQIGIFFTIILLLLRKFRPLASLADRRDSSFGEILLPLGVALAALFAQTLEFFQIALVLLAFADTGAYVAGTTIRSPSLIFHKTLAGSMAYILISTAILAAIQPLPNALIIGCFLGMIELISPKGSDNLTTPIAAVLLLGAV